MIRSRLERALTAAVRASMAGRKVRLPVEINPIWQAFLALSRARGSGAAGPNPITFADILAWSQLMRVPLEPGHVEAICAMDRAFLAEAAASVSQAIGKAKGDDRPQLTPEMFDWTFGNGKGESQ